MTHAVPAPQLLIGGELRGASGGGTFPIIDPATGDVIGHAPDAGDADTAAAIAAARRACGQPGWADAPQFRAHCLRQLKAALEEDFEVLREITIAEAGVPRMWTDGPQLRIPVDGLGYLTGLLESYQWEQDLGVAAPMGIKTARRVRREPAGVVAAITPWNLPLHQIVVKVVPALAAGCTVVLKPAELTPLTAFELARALASAGFPAGVFNLVTGGGRDVGGQLVRSPHVDHVSFTGSTAVGRQVAAAAAGTVKGLTLELGGKSASVVLSDVPDELFATAVKVTVANCFLNGGQTCTALSRLIVPASRLAQAGELAAAAAARYVPGERLGPLISAGQREKVESFLAPGLARAVTAAVELPARGYYVPPTVYSDVEPGSRLAQEEIFGPVLSILAADSDEHAIELANDSIYGLGGALWTGDPGGALDWAARIRAGQVDVNGAPFNPRAPFGGYRQSGIGREIGDYGIGDVLEVKAVQL